MLVSAFCRNELPYRSSRELTYEAEEWEIRIPIVKPKPKSHPFPRKRRAVIGQAIKRGFGLLKRTLEGTSFAQEWAEHKAQEKALEEAKYERCTHRSK